MKAKVGGKLLAILLSFAMVFTTIPMIGTVVYADGQVAISTYTLDLPETINVVPNTEWTAIPVNVTELSLQEEADGRTPDGIRVVFNPGTLKDQNDSSLEIPFKLHTQTDLTGLGNGMNKYWTWAEANNKKDIYIYIPDSDWQSAQPGNYQGTVSYEVRWRYNKGSGSGGWWHNYETGTIPVELVIPEPPTYYTVTYEVENGYWEGSENDPIYEVVEEGQTPNDVPTGMEAAVGYAGGAWYQGETELEGTPEDVEIYDNVTFTYRFTAKPLYTVKYEIENGTWSGGTDPKTETVYAGDKPVNVPAEMTPAEGFGGGAWYQGETELEGTPEDVEIYDNVTFTYKFDTITHYDIKTYAELKAFAALVNSGNTQLDAVLINDIVCDDAIWVPIGNADYPYKGTFDGNGKTIKGLSNKSIDGIEEKDVQGLFGVIGADGVVKNVGLEETDIKGKKWVGGLAGRNEGGLITNCYSTGFVSGNKEVGGVVGVNGGTLTNCYNTGKISGNEYIGGVAGLNDATLTNCYNTGSLSGSKQVGGVAGVNGKGALRNCYNTGTVNGSEEVGGVAGRNEGGNITNCYYDKDLCVVEKAVGDEDDNSNVKGLTTEEMTGADALSTMVFDDNSPWMTKANDSHARYYPHLKGFNFDVDGKQVDAEAIIADNWPPKVEPIVFTPTFNPPSGVFLEPQDISIECATEEATIYYTTDGTNPTTSSSVYTKPIEISDTTTIKAMAVKEGYANSKIASATYTLIHSIKTYADLKSFAALVNSGNTELNAVLINDIVCDDAIWVPIGNADNPYKGTFDGNGKTITGLSNKSIDGIGEKDAQGLFGVIGADGVVKNVGLEETDIKGNKWVGGLAARNNGTISNCYSAGFVSGNKEVGGVVGVNGGTLTNCYNTGFINGSSLVGGVAGLNDATLNNCYNTGEVIGDDKVGGVIGVNGRDANLTNCYNIGEVKGNKWVGGLAGTNEGGLITNCYNTGSVSGNNNEVGGVAGYSNGPLTNCYNTGSVSGNEFVGGVTGLNDKTLSNCYNTGEVSGNSIVGGVAGKNGWNLLTNSYNTGEVSGGNNVGGVAGLNWGTITNCYYDKDLCVVEKAVGNNDDNSNVKGLTTEEMTGADALSTMVFDDNSPWMTKANDSHARYYPHLKGFNFDVDGKQVDAEAIIADNWPPKVVFTPTFNPPSGVYLEAQSIHIECATEGATIYYTTDGTNPTTSSSVYTKPIEISDTTTIKAMAVKEGYANSRIGSATYILPYYIETYAELKAFAALVNSGNTQLDAVLINDIVCDDEEWVPIGNADNPYKGTFDGNVKTITGLSNKSIDGIEEKDAQGLFGVIGADGVVKNVGLEETDIKGNKWVGGLAARNNGTISNCYSAGFVSGNKEVGGVVGVNGGTLTNCYNTGKISGNEYIGGVAGLNDATLNNCYNTGEVSGSRQVGGVAGVNGKGALRNCYNTGTVNGSEEVGGVAGRNEGGNITNCYYDKDLCVVEKAVGDEDDNSNVKGLTTEEMTGADALSTMVFDDNSPWMTKANDSHARYYPHLKGFNLDVDGKQMDANDISVNNWPPKNYTHTWDKGTVTKAATCTSDGVKTYTCTECNATKTEVIEKIGHQYGSWTKLDDKQHQKVCKNDNKHVVKQNHTWDKGTVTKAATCTSDGVKTYTCTVCKATKTGVIEKIGHKYGSWTKLNDKQHQRVCKNDNKHVVKQNHTWDKGKVTKAATCTSDGVKTYTCTVCKATKTGVIKKIGHKYGSWTKLNDKQHQRVCKNDKKHVEKQNHTWDKGIVTKAATYDATGVKTYTCSVCKGNKTETIAKLPKTSIAKAAVNGVEDKPYTGKAVTQTPSVTLNGKTLKSGTDYKVTYANNTKTGTATMTVTGIGAYSGSIKKTFSIVPKNKIWERVYGRTGFDTMKAITEKFGTAKNAVIAANTDFKDSLAAAGLAGSLNAPMLITNPGSLAEQTKSELKRMGVTTVYLIGSTKDVSSETEKQIKDLKIKVVRISGDSPSQKAVEVAKKQASKSDTVIIATQAGFRDALSVSPYAYATKSPVLYPESNNKLSSATINYIKSAKFKNAIIVGGYVALPLEIETQLKNAGISEKNITRLAGANGYATSQVIAEWSQGKLRNGTGTNGKGNGKKDLYYYAMIKFQPSVKMSANYVGISRGDVGDMNWRDALAGAALCGKNKAILLLVDDSNTGNSAVTKASKAQIAHAYVFGGEVAVGKKSWNALVDSIK